MTERRGGSDVGAATETVAIQEQGDMFRCETNLVVFILPYFFVIFVILDEYIIYLYCHWSAGIWL